jgi:hypothetical protein
MVSEPFRSLVQANSKCNAEHGKVGKPLEGKRRVEENDGVLCKCYRFAMIKKNMSTGATGQPITT